MGWETGERALAVEHLSVLEPRDIGVLDRGFASYELFARLIARPPGLGRETTSFAKDVGPLPQRELLRKANCQRGDFAYAARLL